MLIERFIQYLQFEKRFSPHTVTAYQKDLDQFSEFLIQIEMDYINSSHTHIRSWVVELLDKGLEPKSINRKVSCVRSFYKFLQREQLIQKNPMLLVRAPKIPKRLPSIIEEQKLNSLLDKKDIFDANFGGVRDKLVIELLYGTGIRLSELVNLKVTDINIYEQHIKVLGKRNKERIIPTNNSLLLLIQQYIVAKNEVFINNISPMLIVKDNGEDVYPKFIYRIVKSYLSLISHSKTSPHILRHTFATSLLNHGADLNAIKDLLGHASLAATQVYTTNSVERLKSVYKLAHPKA